MKVQQISVFLENKSGRLARVTEVLGENGINIRALSIADTTDFGILRLIVDDPEKAVPALKKGGFVVSTTDVLAVEVDDKPGSLSEAMRLLEQAAINIEYLYAFVQKNPQKALVVFRVEQVDQAIRVLQDNGVTLMPSQEVYKM
ncbi:ACT domain-containing protein [Desulfofalx alkaliphila]|uniref:ACT domain-containing protein n=1 Tax=Desulfofalx alkaliphila TaxID=105483 RepID=UPI0004E12F1D|nr:ACT domain-containing protein [Desulfofalx alkaliphila]